MGDQIINRTEEHIVELLSSFINTPSVYAGMFELATKYTTY